MSDYVVLGFPPRPQRPGLGLSLTLPLASNRWCLIMSPPDPMQCTRLAFVLSPNLRTPGVPSLSSEPTHLSMPTLATEAVDPALS